MQATQPAPTSGGMPIVLGSDAFWDLVQRVIYDPAWLPYFRLVGILALVILILALVVWIVRRSGSDEG